MKKGSFFQKGVNQVKDGMQFVFRVDSKPTGLEIRIFGQGKQLKAYSVPENCRQGNLYSVILERLPKNADSYAYFADHHFLEDRYATALAKPGLYGEGHAYLSSGYRFPVKLPQTERKSASVSYEDAVFYGLHVRGFTKGVGSGTRAKGTFKGLIEKIAYFKELGVTSLIFMPSYEFNERENKHVSPFLNKKECIINYWGYKSGYYYAPKASYARGKDARKEFSQMVQAMHDAGLEVILQFYFDGKTDASEILDILKYWVLTYHVDGFHLIGEQIPVSLLANDPFLKGCKLIGENLADMSFSLDANQKKYVADFSWNYLYDMRKLLKGDEGMIDALLYHFRDNRPDMAVMHSIAAYNGFTLQDLVSYDRKHNECNGEDNQDGECYNYSWNCGQEGNSRKKNIQNLRIRQMKNALALVFLAQGAVYLQSGDEFGNSQDGNNNPYCQDNKMSWIDWRKKNSSKALFTFVKELLQFRQEHPVFRQQIALRNMDYMGHGLPDISYHGEEAWRPNTENYSRSVGMLLCGGYAAINRKRKDHDFYIAWNFHWEPHLFSLPKARSGYSWVPVMDTSQDKSFAPNGSIRENMDQTDSYIVPSRTVMVFEAKEDK